MPRVRQLRKRTPDELSIGRMPDQDRLQAMALHTRRLMGAADQNLLDADAGLEALASGGKFDLSEHGQARAAVLAALCARRPSMSETQIAEVAKTWSYRSPPGRSAWI